MFKKLAINIIGSITRHTFKTEKCFFKNKLNKGDVRINVKGLLKIKISSDFDSLLF